jgi:hypothetical protein
LELGKHHKKNNKKLAEVEEAVWAAAIDKCRVHICMRIRGRTLKGAHTDARLGMDPFDYYLSFAYDALIFGKWEWKDDYTLSEQMIRIIESTLDTEVEKTKTKKASANKVLSIDSDDFWFAAAAEDIEPDMVREILYNKKVSVIEESIKGNDDLENFWECVKDGMKPQQIAEFMEKTPRQIYKIQERLVKKIKESQYFEDL